jgi:regulator of protease activity HflC (stomatin/prohibitin superfamily)
MRKLLLIALLVPLLAACTTVEPGSVGIKVDMLGESRSVDNVAIVVGRVFYNPFSTQVVTYPYTTQRFEWHTTDALAFNSTEGVTLSVDTAISIGVDPARAAELYVKYRRTLPQMIDDEIRDRVNGCLSQSASRMRVDRIIGDGRTEFIDNAIVCMNERLVVEGFVLNDFQITSAFTVPQNIRDRINDGIQAQQAAIAAQNTVAQREAEARQRVAVAQGEADSVRLAAEAAAAARTFQAEAEANAIRIQGAAIRENPEVLTLTFIEKWSGNYPQIVGTDMGGMILNLDNLGIR